MKEVYSRSPTHFERIAGTDDGAVLVAAVTTLLDRAGAGGSACPQYGTESEAGRLRFGCKSSKIFKWLIQSKPHWINTGAP
jgi:hypothetical protein